MRKPVRTRLLLAVAVMYGVFLMAIHVQMSVRASDPQHSLRVALLDQHSGPRERLSLSRESHDDDNDDSKSRRHGQDGGESQSRLSRRQIKPAERAYYSSFTKYLHIKRKMTEDGGGDRNDVTITDQDKNKVHHDYNNDNKAVISVRNETSSTASRLYLHAILDANSVLIRKLKESRQQLLAASESVLADSVSATSAKAKSALSGSIDSPPSGERRMAPQPQSRGQHRLLLPINDDPTAIEIETEETKTSTTAPSFRKLTDDFYVYAAYLDARVDDNDSQDQGRSIAGAPEVVRLFALCPSTEKEASSWEAVCYFHFKAAVQGQNDTRQNTFPNDDDVKAYDNNNNAHLEMGYKENGDDNFERRVHSDERSLPSTSVVRVAAQKYAMCENHGKKYGGWILSCPVPKMAGVSKTSISLSLDLAVSLSEEESEHITVGLDSIPLQRITGQSNIMKKQEIVHPADLHPSTRNSGTQNGNVNSYPTDRRYPFKSEDDNDRRRWREEQNTIHSENNADNQPEKRNANGYKADNHYNNNDDHKNNENDNGESNTLYNNNNNNDENSNNNSSSIIGVCVPPLYGDIDLTKIINFVEMSRILGARRVFLYINDLSGDMRQSLQDYALVDPSFLKLIDWNPPVIPIANTNTNINANTKANSNSTASTKAAEEDDRNRHDNIDDDLSSSTPEDSIRLPASEIIWNRGQLLAIQHCLYANMGAFDWLLFMDVDEMLFPRDHAYTWDQLFQKVLAKTPNNSSKTKAENNINGESRRRPASNIRDKTDSDNDNTESTDKTAGLVFDSAVFRTDAESQAQYNIDYFQKLSRAKTTDKARSKMAVRPHMVFEMGIHHLSRPLRDVDGSDVVVRVPADAALIHHYRDGEASKQHDYFHEEWDLVYDDSSLRYQALLAEASRCSMNYLARRMSGRRRNGRHVVN